MRPCLLTLFLFFAAVSLLGCQESKKPAPVPLENIKIADLNSSYGFKQKPVKVFSKADFGLYVFELPASKFVTLNGICESLKTRPLRFDNPNAFDQYGLFAGFGRGITWNIIADKLRQANAKRIRTTSLIFFDKNVDDVAVTNIEKEITLFHTSSNGELLADTLQPGNIALRITAKKLPGLRGSSKIDIRPVHKPNFNPRYPTPLGTKNPAEIVFDSIGFQFVASPGDFVFITPTKYHNDRTTIPGLLFTAQKKEPTVRMYLIACRRITD